MDIKEQQLDVLFQLANEYISFLELFEDEETSERAERVKNVLEQMAEQTEPRERIYTYMWDHEELTSSDNHAVGMYAPEHEWRMARFKEVALIDPNWIAFHDTKRILVFDDMEILVLKNDKAEMCDGCIEDNRY